LENKEIEILETAERMIQEGGYNAFSFREIAKAVGIKSSSVHYHYPTKADLGVAVASYYTDKFIAHLGDPVDLMAVGKDPIRQYVAAFRDAFIKDRRMCLCGLLGAEVKGLPNSVAAQTKLFFVRNIEWLTHAYEQQGHTTDARDNALRTLSILEGAMIVSNALDDVDVFYDTLKHFDETR